MSYLNKELQDRIDKLDPQNKQLLVQLLKDLGDAKLEMEKKDAMRRLRSKIREIATMGEI